jgi:parallel beta helix pectate lyase-like protein
MKARFCVHVLLCLLIMLTVSVAAQAQATRTWVSGVGDDANPCSRTAPCKTFAGAISKTATGGEINVLDPGGFGAVTITKSITISSESFEAGVLVSGTNGIVISAPTNANVVLRGLDIEGLGTGLSGIKVLTVGSLHVENCTINNFTQSGIEFVPTSGTNVQLHVSNTIARNNFGVGSFAAIHVKPAAGVTVIGLIENTLLKNNSLGLRVEDNSNITAKNTTAADNTGAGFLAVSNSTAVTLNLESCVATGNLNGIKADNPNATVRISNCMIAGNTNGLVTTTGPGHIVSFGNNHNADNGIPNGPNIGPQ